MALPEHAPRLPHIPVSDLRGRLRWLQNHWRSIGLVLTGIGSLAYGVSQLVRPYTPDIPITDNRVPITDTFKPLPSTTPDNQGISPAPTSGGVGPEPKGKLETPEVNPMEEALRNGKIELGPSSNPLDYFQPVSKAEAQANTTPEFPVNPKRNPNLKIGTEITTNSRGESFTILTLDNVENDEPIRATEAGNFRIDNVGGGNTPETKNDTYKLARIEIGDRKGSNAPYLFYIKTARIPDNFIWGKTYPVNPGDILFYVVNSNAVLPSSLSKNQHQIEIMLQGVNNPDSPLANFVDPATGKIPFIDDSPPGK